MKEYNLEYLNSLIENKVEENLNLEYKASGALGKQNNKTTEISKDVSSLANSDGGIIIYGIAEDNNNHLPKEISPVDRNQYSNEWLEQIIQSKIRPRLNDFKIHPIDIDTENVVYVVQINKSNTAHQADDKRYYKRFNFQSTAMYDYEVRDILNRNKNPIISLDFKFENQLKEIVIYAINSGAVYAKYVNVKFIISKSICDFEYYDSHDHKTFQINTDNTIRDLLATQFSGSDKYGPSRYVPILPRQRFELIKIKLTDFAFDHDNILEWEIFCDNSQPIAGKVRFADLLK
ncbi:AlbA family DNA-binding domain-containing protein [Zobellia barbeyronii]|uniref:ATP-binding protein n=1 Tax=Zobellia barbeyronii TaxID=2748009 RepID=A0ABS5WJI9_9FLAO|nr:ATP-binding protein [Zobellia barbeyronii]MBT2163515.1 ATP-binding protein [Zobellia barbeyronii]